MHITHTVTPKDSAILRVVQITDTHLFSSTRDVLLGVNTAESLDDILEKCVAEHQDIDFFIVTGDIAQQQDKRIYERFFRRMNTIGTPYFCIAGNHDANEHLLSKTYPIDYADNQVIEMPHWRIIMLNSSFEEQPSGKITPADMQWLADFLATHDKKHTVICLHHHPVPMKSAWIDQHMLQDADVFWEKIAPYHHIKAIICGHVHQAFDSIHQGKRVIASPSTSIQFKPQCDDFTVDNLPAGFRWLEMSADGTINTGIKRLDNVPDTIELQSEGY